MERFILLNNDGEIVNKTTQLNIENAIEYFSIIKNIPKNKLIKIYKVKKYEDRYHN